MSDNIPYADYAGTLPKRNGNFTMKKVKSCFFRKI